MKKRRFIILLCILTAFAICLAACADQNDNGNESSDSTAFDNDLGTDTINDPSVNRPTDTETEKCVSHIFGDWTVTKPATCTESGMRTRKCSICNAEENDPIEKLDHTESDWITDKAASCTESGLKHTECSICHATLKSEAIEKIAHTEGDWITDKAASCTESGLKHTECSICHSTLKSEAIEKIAHTEGDWITDKAASCTENGLKHTECSICHATLKSETIEKIAHTEGDWITDKAASCTESGLKHTECSICHSIVRTGQISKLEHTYVKGVCVCGASKFKFTADDVVLGNDKISSYSAFNDLADPAYLIPGLKKGFIPQGMDVWDEMGWLMISGYFESTSVLSGSVIFAVDLNTGKFVAEYYLKNSDGSPHASHAGGVAITSKNMFISNGSKLYRIPLADIKAADYVGDIRIVEEISVPVRASFCNYSGGVLWVGDFYKKSKYPTDEFRHMKNRDGNMYYAWCVGYKLTDETENELSSDKFSESFTYATPDIILSIRDQVQGFTVVSDKYIALSCSYGRTNVSHIYLYNNVLNTEAHGSYNLNGKDIPLWFLDNKTGCKDYICMPMAEGLATYNGKLLILYESGADKYRNGGGTDPTDMVWSMSMPK